VGTQEEAARIIAQARRYLEDLAAFEGDRFLAPAALFEAESTPRPEGVDAAARELDSFCRQICECTRCRLGKTRGRFVFGSGNPAAGIVFVGEAPGFEEDRRGLPFVGAAGQLLTRMIEAIKMGRDDVYICNMIKCHPPNNRDPQPDEIESCSPYLKRQISILQPRVICALGRIASQALLQTSAPMRELRGRLHEYEGIPLVVTYHPAALLRNPGWKRGAWEDMKQLRRQYDGLEL
jgi:DNA polymerase